MIFFMDNCVHLLRTLPTLPSDPLKPDDINTDAEDHAADALRYGCMARPYTPPAPVAARNSALGQYQAAMQNFTLEDIWMTAPGLGSDSRVIPRN